jgi:hypothetical protein
MKFARDLADSPTNPKVAKVHVFYGLDKERESPQGGGQSPSSLIQPQGPLMGISNEQLAAILGRNPSLARRNPHLDNGPGPRPVIQKPEVHREEKGKRHSVSHDKARKKKVDGASHPKYRVSITLKVSDNARRDGDGGASTLLDCLVHAARRLQAMDTGTACLLH